MIVWREWWQRLRGALGSRAEHTDLDEELSAHLAMLTDEHAAQGMTPAEAARLPAWLWVASSRSKRLIRISTASRLSNPCGTTSATPHGRFGPIPASPPWCC